MKKLRKFISLMLVLAMVFSLAACGKKTETGKDQEPNKTDAGKEGEKTDSQKHSFAFIVTNQLGDKSFNDSAAEGTKKITKELGYETNIIEVGDDQTKWEPAILDVAESGKYSAIFLNGSGTIEIIERIAANFPNVKFVLFDTVIEDGSMSDNVFAISYKQNEGSYLGGVVAALVTSSKMEHANEEHKIGFIGGDEGPIIKDFVIGYIEGAKSILPDIKVYISYVGSWTDTAKAKELANAQFAKGVDVIFPAAMTAGLGCIEAATEQGKYIIGVDSDQALLLEKNNPEQANVVLTSVIKNVGESLFHYAESVKAGTDKYNTTQILGVKEGTTDIVENKYYEKHLSKELRDKVDEARNKIVNGEITVSSALSGDQTAVDKTIESVTP